VTTATASDTRHLHELLPAGLVRDLPGMSAALLRPSASPPSSIKAAIVRWLNQEL
jgi:hypothetical protein